MRIGEVFISHTHADRAIADALSAAIKSVFGDLLTTSCSTKKELDGGIGGLGESWRWSGASIALAGALILAVVPVVLRTKASKDRVQEWVRARSASEALKEEML